MEHLSGFLIYASSAVLVPVLIAGVVVWGDWRTVGIACAIWYGFIGLAFGAWALIIAMFYSVIGVPVLAILVKVSRAARSWAGF